MEIKDDTLERVSNEEGLTEDYPDMETMVRALGESCLDRPLEYPRNNLSIVPRHYKGLEIIKNVDKTTGVNYFTVVNNQNGSHLHFSGKNMARRACDCFHDFRNGKSLHQYEKYFRKCALGLSGFNIKIKSLSAFIPRDCV